MNTLEKACLLSCENWVDSFPEDIPKHKFSKKHQEKMKTIFQQEQRINLKFSKKTIKILLIAAILLSLTMTAFAIPSCREFIVNKFFNHSEYNVVDTNHAEKVTALKLNYIPTGFEITEDYGYVLHYEKGDENFIVEKLELTSTIGFDTEKYQSENIKINGANAVYYRSDNDIKGIIFNNGKYIFEISGNIDKETLVRIAQNVE